MIGFRINDPTGNAILTVEYNLLKIMKIINTPALATPAKGIYGTYTFTRPPKYAIFSKTLYYWGNYWYYTLNGNSIVIYYDYNDYAEGFYNNVFYSTKSAGTVNTSVQITILG